MYSLPAKKSLGQHFLTSPRIPKLMVQVANLRPDDIILEIGPGTGVLTEELLHTGNRVIAVEADMRAYTILTERFTEACKKGQLTLIHGDVRTYTARTLGCGKGDYVVIANIPYFITGLLLRQFLEEIHPPRALVYLMQKEVAERIAREKKESLLSLSVKLFGDPRYEKTVARGNFTPPPRVDSAILSVKDISTKRLKGLSSEFIFSILHTAFGSRRKQCIGNLTAQYHRAFLEETFTSLMLPHTIRAEDISVEKWILLCKKLYAHHSQNLG